MKPILLDLPMPIFTPRLLIRPVQPGDGQMVYEAIQETLENLAPWMPWGRVPPSVADAEENIRRAYAAWILREDIRLQILDRKTQRFLGGTGLHRFNWDIRAFEIGYWIRKSAEGKGFVSEAANALTRYAFEVLKAKRVELRCNPENKKSDAVARRLGFEFEGRLRNTDTYASAEIECRDHFVFSRLNKDGLPDLEVSW